MNGRSSRALISLLVLAGLAVPLSSARACASGHLGVRWVRFQSMSDLGPIFFYNGTEPNAPTSVPITIRGVGDDCSNPPQPVLATYQVRTPGDTNRPATSGTDYIPIPSKQSQPLYGYHAQGPTEQPDNVPIQPDFEPEPVIEEAEALISGSTGTREVPWDVPIYIIDNDGLERASFEHGGTYERAEIYGSMVVPVFRAGPATGAATYDFTISGSSGAPATEGEDFSVASHTVSFAANERVKLITVQLVNDKKTEPAEEATITLSSPGTLLPPDPSSTAIRILDGLGGPGEPISSSLHHPNDRRKYRASDFKLREIHIFTKAIQGPPVTGAEFALRQNRKRNTCSWWTGRRFKKGDCADEVWIDTGQYETDFFYYRLDQLRPSVGKIKTYSAFSRARSGNLVESGLDKGRNANTFEVKKPKK